MQYMGGKTRIAKQIAAVIDQYREPGQLVWDAFCGGLSVSVALSKKGPVLASDVCAPLINLYKAVQEGWDPPTEVSKETWQAAKLLPDTDPMKAFCGFGCSFGGKWFGGYSSPRKGSGWTAAGQGRVIKRDVGNLIFEINDFLTSIPEVGRSIIYCDPPYRGTTSYFCKFNHSEFYTKCLEWSRYADVFISEYSCPIGKCIWEGKSLTRVNAGMSGRGKQATEKLFHIPKQS